MKLLEWFLNLTKLGKGFGKVQTFLDGKKTYIVGVGMAVPALTNILGAIAQDGLPALLNVAKGEDWVQLMLGIGMITGKAAITKAAKP